MKPHRVRLYVKPYCGWCHQAIAWLDRRGVAYEKLDVTADRAAWAEMERLSGQTLAPVIQVDGRVLADFGVPELETFWQQLSLA
jgi:glutaredoxin